MKKYKPVSNWIFAFPIIMLFSSALIYDKFFKSSDDIKENQNIKQTQYENNEIIKLKDGYHFYAIKDNDEIKNIIKIITRDCKGDEVCEVEKEFEYVNNKPYVISNKDRNPNEVINKDGGDCDEKSYLFASMLKATNHKCVVVYTKQHAFVAVHIKDIANLYRNTTSLRIDNKYYFYAETTAKGSYIGWFNGVDKKSIETIYNVNEDKEVPLEEIEFLQV
jgi:hypothetical protein